MSSDDDELSAVILSSKGQTRNRRLLTVPKTAVSNRSSRQRNSQSQVSLVSMSSRSSSDGYGQGKKRRSAARTRGERAPRAATQRKVNYSDIPAFEDLDDESDVDISRLGKRKRSSIDPGRSRKLLRGSQRRDSPVGARRSGRNTALRDTQEVGEDDIPETATNNAVTRFVGAKEFFRALSSEDDFRIRHCQTCDTCYEDGDNEEKGLLVYCQGCTLSYHQKCLGKGTSREHLVTKIGEKNSVLQCRRCVGFSKQKDPLSPDQGLCMSCHEPGSSTTAFRERKTPSQEQKERENNNGIDPVTDILPDLINNSQQVLFRCMECYRACHLYHLPAKIGAIGDLDEEEAALARFEEYSRNWTCKDCLDKPADVVALVAWRPTDSENYKSGRTADEVREDEKDYLVRFKKLSYSKVQWKPGAWVWGVTAPAMRKAFFKRDNGYNLPKMTTQDAVPEEYLRVDIVFDVEYTNLVKQSTEKIAKARVKEVKRALVKFKGLGYEDVLWEEPPPQEDGGRWDDFKTAYEDWVMGSFIHPPAPKTLEANITRVRSQNFAQKLELKNQPESLTGGELMEYQMQGLNWLYYQWHRCQNAILADEMGLGKTIQIIGFLATLKQFHGCWPFLIVVPNSTCPNWRREIKQWAPSLRVVMYYGSAESRRLASRHELFPGGAKELRCHIVVTSYDAAQEDEFRRIFKYVHWAGLVVDEGQRLKNDESILYGSLNALKIPFKVLLTGMEIIFTLVLNLTDEV